MNITDLLIPLASVLTKTGFKLWAGDNILAQEASTELVDLIKSKYSDYKQQRNLTSIFTAVENEVFENLEKLSIQFNTGEISEAKQFDIIYAIQNSIINSNIKHDEIINANLDSTFLETLILRNSSSDYGSLNNAEKVFFNKILSSCCIIMVGITENIPSFNVLVQRELLKRTDLIVGKIESVCDEIFFRSVSNERDAKEFEIKYLRSYSDKVKKYNLFGLDVIPQLKNIDLSVSYISLTAYSESQNVEEGTDIEELLSNSSRYIISGNPGSGKTTLLQWLGMIAAQGMYSHHLEHWNSLVPFTLPLREYSDKKLPTINELAKFSASTYIEMMPDKWAGEIFSSGKALLLIDGFDELSDEKRNEVLSWLNEVVSTFPKNVFIMTSRPNAIIEATLDSIDGLVWLS